MLNENSVIYILRDVISSWYNAIRTIGIACMLIVLVYIGIRIAIASIGEQKAKYQRILKDWIVAFVLMFLIHYIMIGVVSLNEAIVNLVRGNVLSEGSLFEQILVRAYDLRLSVGVSATIMYVILVIFTVSYFIAYLKRYFTIAILTIFAPIVSISYAIDKIKDGTSQSLSTWLKEYIFNVLLQSIHAIIYTVFISISVKIALEGMGVDANGQVTEVKDMLKSLGNLVPAVVFMITSLKLEKIAREILEFTSAGTQEDTTGDTMEDMLGAMYLTKGSRQGLMAPVKTAGKIAAVPFKVAGGAYKVTSTAVKNVLDIKKTPEEREFKPNKLQRFENFVSRKVKRHIKKPIKNIKKHYKAAKEMLPNAIGFGALTTALNTWNISREYRDEQDFIHDNIGSFAIKNRKGKYEFMLKDDDTSNLIRQSIFTPGEQSKIDKLQKIAENSKEKFEAKLKAMKDMEVADKERMLLYAKKQATVDKIEDDVLRGYAERKLNAEKELQKMAEEAIARAKENKISDGEAKSSKKTTSTSNEANQTNNIPVTGPEQEFDKSYENRVYDVLVRRVTDLLDNIVELAKLSQENIGMDESELRRRIRYSGSDDKYNFKKYEYDVRLKEIVKIIAKDYFKDENKVPELLNWLKANKEDLRPTYD